MKVTFSIDQSDLATLKSLLTEHGRIAALYAETSDIGECEEFSDELSALEQDITAEVHYLFDEEEI